MPGKNTTWTEANKSDYNALYNLLVNKKVYNIEAHKFDFIIFYNKALMKHILSNKAWQQGTQNNKIYMCVNWLNKFDSKNEVVTVFKEEGYRLRKLLGEEEGENKMNKKEEENMRPLTYFQDILKSYEFPKILEDKAMQFKYVLLAMLILQTPIRTSFYNSAKFIFKKTDDDKQHNFIFIPKKQKTQDNNYHKT